jgi:hypothetical protein
MSSRSASAAMERLPGGKGASRRISTRRRRSRSPLARRCRPNDALTRTVCGIELSEKLVGVDVALGRGKRHAKCGDNLFHVRYTMLSNASGVEQCLKFRQADLDLGRPIR